MTAAPVSADPGLSPALTPPPGNPRFALFDSLRAIAVLGVIVFHVLGTTGALDRPVVGNAATVLGSQGPLLFFVISGFLLYRPYVAARAAGREGPSLHRYARRRVLRIVPAYWVALTVLAIFPGIVGAFTGDWWRYYFFLQVYGQDSAARGIPVAWTLCVEAAFYVTLPFWALAIRRVTIGSGPRRWLRAELAALAAVAAAGITVQVFAARNVVSDLTATTILGECVWLALGMALAVLSVAVDGAPRTPRAVRAVAGHPTLCWLAAGGAFVALGALLGHHGLLGIAAGLAAAEPIGRTLVIIALGAVLIVGLMLPAVFGEHEGGAPRRVLAWRPLAWIGLVSYGMYLWHLTVTEFLALPADPSHFSARGLDLSDRVPDLATPVLLVLTLALTAVIAAASYYLVELPFLRRKER